MNKILLLFIIIFGLTNAQTYRFFYDVKSTPDSTTSEHQKHIMVLDVNPKDTKYYDYAFLEKDSINKALNLHDTNWTEQIPVVRKRNTHKNTNYRMIEFTLYSYETEDPIKWALTDDVESYAGFKVQKATSHFGGRDWTAWFTKEIPFSEGPYKFQGLPGLIVLLEDSQQQYSFSLVKSKNLPQTYNTDNILEVRYGQRPLAVTEKIYIAKAIEYFNDPFHKVMEGLRNGTVTNYEDNGTKYTRPEQLIPLIKEEQGYILRDNNPIEKNKAIKYPVKK